MSRLPSLFIAVALGTKAAFATIIIAVGTRDGLLLCEDRRLTTKSGNGQITFADGDKAQQLGKFGFFAIAGDVSGTVTNFFGQPIKTFDILSEIPSFFKTHDIQQFNQEVALDLEAHLRAQLSRKPANLKQQPQGSKAQTEVILYWMDRAGQTHLYVVDMASALDSSSTAPATSSSTRLVGHFISLGAFATSKPLVRGRGLLGYNAIAEGTNPDLDDLRHDEELRPFLSNFMEANTVDSIAAARALKKLIRSISERQILISPDGLDVGSVSDCYLGTADGIKNINQ